MPLPVSCRPLECRRREHCPNRPPSATSHAYSSLPLVSTPVSSPHPHLPLPPPQNAGWQAGSTGSHGYERIELLFGSKTISSHEHKVLVFGSKPISLPYGEEGSDKCYYKASSSTRRMFQNLILYFACDNDVYSPLTIICLRACKKCFVRSCRPSRGQPSGSPNPSRRHPLHGLLLSCRRQSGLPEARVAPREGGGMALPLFSGS